jgi:hypothetical protein
MQHMKKNEQKKNIGEAKPQKAAPTKAKGKGKYQPGIKNTATDAVLAAAGQTPGRNQAKTKREDIQPLD